MGHSEAANSPRDRKYLQSLDAGLSRYNQIVWSWTEIVGTAPIPACRQAPPTIWPQDCDGIGLGHAVVELPQHAVQALRNQ
jgi:hypothetical protein